MSKTIKRLDLLFREVQDSVAQENFYRIKAYMDNLASTGLVGPPGPQGPPGPPGISGGVADFAGALKVTRTASVAITLGDAVYAISSTHVGLADASNTVTEAMVFGFALNNASPGADVDVLILGVLEDPPVSPQRLFVGLQDRRSRRYLLVYPGSGSAHGREPSRPPGLTL